MPQAPSRPRSSRNSSTAERASRRERADLRGPQLISLIAEIDVLPITALREREACPGTNLADRRSHGHANAPARAHTGRDRDRLDGTACDRALSRILVRL